MILRFRTNPFIPESLRPPLLVQFGAMVQGTGGVVVIVIFQRIGRRGHRPGAAMGFSDQGN